MVVAAIAAVSFVVMNDRHQQSQEARAAAMKTLHSASTFSDYTPDRFEAIARRVCKELEAKRRSGDYVGAVNVLVGNDGVYAKEEQGSHHKEEASIVVQASATGWCPEHDEAVRSYYGVDDEQAQESDGEATPDAETLTATGVLVLRSSNGKSDNNNFLLRTTTTCYGIDGYDDLDEGGSVTVYDAVGKIVGISSLDTGKLLPSEDCAFGFAVPDIPATSDIYSIEVSHRGKVNFTQDQADSLSFSIGD